MATQANITSVHELWTGKDYVLQFTVEDSDGVAVDITGYAISWSMFPKLLTEGAATIPSFAAKTVGSGITLTDATNGILQVVIDDVDTDVLVGTQTDIPDYRHELRRTDSGSEAVLSYGSVVLKQSPSQD